MNSRTNLKTCLSHLVSLIFIYSNILSLARYIALLITYQTNDQFHPGLFAVLYDTKRSDVVCELFEAAGLLPEPLPAVLL